MPDSLEQPEPKAPKGQVDAQPVDGKGAHNTRLGVIVIAGATVAFLVYLVVSGQFTQFVDALSGVQAPWIIVACFCMCLNFVFGVLAYGIAAWLDPDSPVGVRDLIAVEAAGLFFGNLTPMMVGGTPMQIYTLTKAGQPVGEAGATQFTRFIMFQLALVLWAGIMMFARMPFFMEQYSDVAALGVLCIFSFGGHICLLAVIFAIALAPKMVIRVAHWILSLVARMGVSAEKVSSWSEFVDGEVGSFSQKFRRSAGHLSSMALTAVVTMLQLASLYLVPYFVMRSFGLHDADPFTVMAAAAFVQLLSTAVPLPGGTGGAEGGFALFLGHFFGGAATAGFLLWRLITFIIPTIASAPLLSLHSRHEESLHARWQRFRGGHPGLAGKLGVGGRSSARRSVAAAPNAPDETAPAASSGREPVRPRAHVRRSPGGITVDPDKFMKRRRKR